LISRLSPRDIIPHSSSESFYRLLHVPHAPARPPCRNLVRNTHLAGPKLSPCLSAREYAIETHLTRAYRSIKVSKLLRAFLDGRPEFEYQCRLEKHGLVSTCGIQYPYGSRLFALKSFLRSWQGSGGQRPPTQTYDIEGDCIAYELVAGVFAKTDGSSFTVQWLPSYYRPARQLVRSHSQLGIPIKDFALDPTQDVVALLAADNLCVFQFIFCLLLSNCPITVL
jgi:hypothetical protein